MAGPRFPLRAISPEVARPLPQMRASATTDCRTAVPCRETLNGWELDGRILAEQPRSMDGVFYALEYRNLAEHIDPPGVEQQVLEVLKVLTHTSLVASHCADGVS